MAPDARGGADLPQDAAIPPAWRVTGDNLIAPKRHRPWSSLPSPHREGHTASPSGGD